MLRHLVSLFALQIIFSNGLLAENSNISQVPWIGTAGSGRDSIKMRFDIATSGTGEISGIHVLYDPISKKEVRAGTLSGHRNGPNAEWSTLGGVKVSGKFSGNDFQGKVTFPGALSFPPLVVDLHLTTDPQNKR